MRERIRKMETIMLSQNSFCEKRKLLIFCYGNNRGPHSNCHDLVRMPKLSERKKERRKERERERKKKIKRERWGSE